MSFVFACLVAQARLGEAITECDLRYHGGKPGKSSAADLIKPLATGPNTTNLTYIHNGFTIRIGFTDGVATVIDYNKMSSQKTTPEELEAILEANGGGWEEVPDYSSRRRWKGLDELSALAGKGRVWMRTPDYSGACLYNLGRSLRMKLKAVTPPRSAGGPPGAEKPKPSGGAATKF